MRWRHELGFALFTRHSRSVLRPARAALRRSVDQLSGRQTTARRSVAPSRSSGPNAEIGFLTLDAAPAKTLSTSRNLEGKYSHWTSLPRWFGFARARGVNARVLPMEGIHVFADTFELVLSNFGGLNCVRDLSTLCETLARLVRPQGFLAICLMSRFCLWESAYYAVRGQFKNAARRWRGAAMTSRGLSLVYPSSKQVRRALLPDFRSGGRCRRRNPGSAILRGADVARGCSAEWPRWMHALKHRE